MTVATHLTNRHFAIILIAIIASFSISFSDKQEPKESVANYYAEHTGKLLSAITDFEEAASLHSDRKKMLPYFFACRNRYKSIELFIDVFIPNKGKAINGPDLLKIDEENPSDSLFPHGFQVIETILYEDTIDKHALIQEIKILKENVTALRNDPDRAYYFRDDRIWRALKLGIYRMVSMGVTGFDVPFTNHSLPECRVVLKSIGEVAGFYKNAFPDSVWKSGVTLISRADSFLGTNNDFNTFDRLEFIRSFINPLSAWLTDCSIQYDFINQSERFPINPFAKHLFAYNIIDIDFFSPNKSFRVTPERVLLGKRLFYDPALSGNGSRSCASCHQPSKAFTDGLAKPFDLSGKKELLRNTPTLWNTALQTTQFYDSRTRILENQLSAVVHNSDEMAGSLKGMIPVLKDDDTYAIMFRNAYPEELAHITEYNIANAISSYVRTLISFNSPFDKYIRRETDSLSVEARGGFNLFMGKAKCGTCHYAPIFNGLIPPLYEDTESETLAVPATDDSISTIDPDPGKCSFTHHPFHKYAFKTPTVRNAALTAPYMHNGVFNDLEALLNFYNDGGGAGRGINLATQTLPTEKLDLSATEKNEIIAFIQSLTDTAGNGNR